jgi:transposase
MWLVLLKRWRSNMFLPSSVKIFMSDKPVDMRKGFDGLMAIVRSVWRHDVFSGHLFVFLGVSRDRAKILYWDKGGFVLFYKRLESGRFKCPKILDGQAIELDSTELIMLLDGIDFAKVTRKKHWTPKSCG